MVDSRKTVVCSIWTLCIDRNIITSIDFSETLNWIEFLIRMNIVLYLLLWTIEFLCYSAKCLEIFDGIIKSVYSYNDLCSVSEFLFKNSVIIESLYQFVSFQ